MEQTLPSSPSPAELFLVSASDFLALLNFGHKGRMSLARAGPPPRRPGRERGTRCKAGPSYPQVLSDPRLNDPVRRPAIELQPKQAPQEPISVEYPPPAATAQQLLSKNKCVIKNNTLEAAGRSWLANRPNRAMRGKQ